MRKTEDQLILVILLMLPLLKFISTKRKVLDRLHNISAQALQGMNYLFQSHSLTHTESLHLHYCESSGRDISEVPQRMAGSMLVYLLPEDFGTPWDSLFD